MRHPAAPLLVVVLALLLATVAPTRETTAQEAFAPETVVEPEARAIAETVLERMGGRDAWDATHYVSWTFFGGRQHVWDKWTGDIRIDAPEGENRDGSRRPARLTLMNINTREGRVWLDGVEVPHAQAGEYLEQGWGAWVNDSYWAFMPWKLLDPGVNLRYVGEDLMADDRQADVLELTFESVGVTPQNRYLVYVARDSGLVEQWSYFADRDAEEPGFTMPWADYERFGSILLATDHGRGSDWNFAVHDSVPEGLFTDPAVTLE